MNKDIVRKISEQSTPASLAIEIMCSCIAGAMIRLTSILCHPAATLAVRILSANALKNGSSLDEPLSLLTWVLKLEIPLEDVSSIKAKLSFVTIAYF